ncbi:MAG: ATP-dependent helicase [Candidatus Magasanikbacteria bacterium]|nr:ATP-dependent helicase [Candidatus Magasanikbacteria bacterium]
MANYKLNPSQKQAVEYVSGPLIIVAGAGTGKTTVITQKIFHILQNKLAKTSEILALTFTEKAAAEMFDRVDAEVGIGYVDLQISTFHSFCQKILEEYGLDIGISNKFKLLTEVDAWLLVRQNLDKFNLDYYRSLGNPTNHIHTLISHFQKCKDELITPADYLRYVQELQADTDNAEIEEKNRLAELANAYHVYNQLLLDNNYLDFADLIFYTIKLLKERPAILKLLQNRFKYILVDEFQDVNWAQYQLVRLLTGSNSQLTVVGDDDQSIYAFRGASVSNILRFKDDFPKAQEIVLNENYRSRQEILDSAYKLIQHNNPDRLEVKLQVNKKLVNSSKTSASKGKSVVHLHSATLDQEVRSVIEEIKKIKDTDKEAAWDDFAILVRANNHSEPFISALEKAGIPYEFLAASGLYRQPLVLDCINFFKLLDNYRESSAIFRLLLMPIWKMDDHDIQKITFNAKRKSISFYEALKRAVEFGLSSNGIAAADKLLTVIHAGMQNAKNEKPTTVLFHFLQDSGLLEYLAKEEVDQNREVIRQIYQLKEFFEYMGGFENSTPGAHVASFLEHLNYIMESGDLGAMYQPTETPDSVNIITVHKSKGLEFKYVFVVNLVEDRFPGRRRGEPIEIPAALIKEQMPSGDSHYQEERRLFYVAMTRAKERLYLTSADDYGGVKTKKISRFLPEIEFSVLEKEAGKKEPLKISIPSKNKEKGEFIYELPKVFSFSQIKSYRTCPYQYKLAHVLKIPTKGNASFSFGQSIHSALQKFYERLKDLNRATQTSLFALPEKVEPSSNGVKAPSLQELFNFYEAAWIDDWYKSKAQREEYYKLGKEILQTFYNTEKDNWTIPISLEGWFKIKIGNYLVNGRIDRIDQLPNGQLEIIDYKTGNGKEKLESEDKDQLLLYQIAVNELPEYKNIGAPERLTYFYLNDNLKVSFLGNEKDIEKLKEKVVMAIDKINSQDFTATPSPHVCKRCDFRDICQFRA